MALTRDFKKTIAARLHRDPEFAKAIQDEAALCRGDWATAGRLLREMLDGKERIAAFTVKTRKRA